MTQQNQIFETMSPNRLFMRCAIPSMVSMAVSSLYTIADGIFVGRFVGSAALAAINLVMPVITISFAFADMIAVGSAVQIAIRLGEKRNQEASRIFTVCSLLIVAMACIIGLAGYFGAEPLLNLMGADTEVTALAVEYTKVFAAFAPFIMVFFAVDNYLRICGCTRYSMMLNIITALLNIILDFVFLGVLHLSVGAAALASCLSLTLGTVLGYWPFLRKRLPLQFIRGKIQYRMIGNILYNGSSEFFSNVAGSILMIIMNSILLYLSGSMAVAAFSIVLYVDSIVTSLLYGMTDSMQPAISYCYGARLRRRMFVLEKRVLIAGAVISAVTLAGMRMGGDLIISLFIQENDPALLEMSLRAIKLFSFTYLTSWIGVGLGAFFTAVNKPGISLGISMGRALVFPVLALAVLTPVLGMDGVWVTPAVSGGLAAIVAVCFLVRFLHREK
ncbi:MAG: MATE family efflux transporter [Lachnospiraceae bacterium]|jgi:putative MATE family efflux protein|nr:MATE family efflux transporter [Lachnospiraceae bacterium]